MHALFVFMGSYSSSFPLPPSPPLLYRGQNHPGGRFARVPHRGVGASFASRVGASLLRNAGPSQSALLVAGQREYEDLAVDLVSTERGRRVLSELRASLNDAGHRRPNRSQAGREGSVAGRGAGEKAGAEGRGRPLPIFDTEAITKELNQAFMLMSDVHGMWKDRHRGAPGHADERLPHIVLTGRNANNLGLERDCKLEMYACEVREERERPHRRTVVSI